MNPDAALLERFVGCRDAAAIGELVQRHIHAVHSAALRRVGGDPHLAADVTQQVFVAMTRQAPALVRHPALGAWLHRATRNQAVNAVRAERRRKTREEEAMKLTDGDTVDWRQVGPVLDDVMDALREADRTAVVLRFFEQRSYAEIGAVLGMGEDGARRRVERALERMRHLLIERRIPSSAAALAAALSTHSVSAAPPGLAAHVTSAVATLAPATLTPAAALLAFMTTTKVAVGIGGAAAVLCAVVFTVPAWQDLNAARSEERKLVERASVLQRDRGRLEQRLRERERELERLEGELSAKAGVVSPDEAVRPPMEVEGEAFLARHPDLRGALNAWLDGRTEYRWGPFLRERGVTPAQREAFMALMREGSALGLRRRDGEEPDWYLRGGTQAGEAFYQQMREILGEEGLRAFREHRRQEPARRIAAQAAAALTFSDAPLQPAQLDQVVRVLAEFGAGKGGLPEVDLAGVEQGLRGHLDAGQLEIVRAAVVRAHRSAELTRISAPSLSPQPPRS